MYVPQLVHCGDETVLDEDVRQVFHLLCVFRMESSFSTCPTHCAPARFFKLFARGLVTCDVGSFGLDLLAQLERFIWIDGLETDSFILSWEKSDILGRRSSDRWFTTDSAIFHRFS